MSSINFTLGIAGTAKNTGKTTTTIALLNYFNSKGIRLGLTSIGYDGESVDNITGLPKPRLFVPKETFVVTAERCLEVSSAKLSIIEKLPISTPLGNLVCCVVEREGLVVTAGPNQTKHVRTVREWLYNHGAEIIIVDGALNRMAPMVETDGFILATGASYKADINQIALDASYLANVCNYPTLAQDFKKKSLLNTRATVIWDENGNVLASTSLSLFDAGQLEPLAKVASRAEGLYCPGLITSSCLKQMPKIAFPEEMSFVFENPIKILVGNEPGLAYDVFANLREKGNSVAYYHPLPLLAITVNPFYPKFRYESNDYEPAFVDPIKLKQSVADLTHIPVFNVVEDGSERLAEAILSENKIV